MTINTKSQFEVRHFDSSPATIITAPSVQASIFGAVVFNETDIRELSGAPSHSTIEYRLMTQWGNTGSDKPPLGLYFFSTHPLFIEGTNAVGLYNEAGVSSLYIKDIFFNTKAPAGLGAVMLARIVRACQRFGVAKIRLLAAGGRYWPDIPLGRWGGYYAWPRYGFDMPLTGHNQAIIHEFPYFPPQLGSCVTVQDVIQDKFGCDWWAMCGNGSFMEFDCSPTGTAVARLDSYLNAKGL